MIVALPEFRKPHVQLFLLGFLTLFLELALIRYLPGSIWNLGYFPNLVLVAAFLGMGIGFVMHSMWSDEKSLALFRMAPACLTLLLLLVVLFRPSLPLFTQWSGEIGQELYFTNVPNQPASYALLPFILWFFGVVALFVIISQRTAKVFRKLRPLEAYTVDIAGSCCGILAFMIMSYLHLPPLVWFLLMIPLFVKGAGVAATHYQVLIVLPFAVISAIVILQDRVPTTGLAQKLTYVEWSPYQKVELVGDRVVNVNGIGHQDLLPAERIGDTYYQVIYDDRKVNLDRGYEKVLILGAGAGNDVVAALQNGAQQVDAVEIDPVIAEIGRTFHPDKPYDDPRVRLIIDDGRAFLTQSTQRYDLIVFALTDSLVKVSPIAQLRLENYLFTREAIERAHSLLAEDGDLLFYNYYRRPWLLEKIEKLVTEVTGAGPVALATFDDFAVMAAGATHRAPPSTSTIATPTDDWPFLYVQHRRLPAMYAQAVTSLVIISFGLLFYMERRHRIMHAQRARGASLPMKYAFMLMGIAFLLLETKSVIQFSLLFGTTWINNSLVFLAVLLLVLAANWIATFTSEKRLGIMYALLVLSSLLTFFYPIGNLLAVENEFWRFTAASLLTFSPIFFANLIFSTAFRNQPKAEILFGWNLVGAMLGGVIEYSSVALGFNALTWVVVGCYTAVVLLVQWEFRVLPKLTVAR